MLEKVLLGVGVRGKGTKMNDFERVDSSIMMDIAAALLMHLCWRSCRNNGGASLNCCFQGSIGRNTRFKTILQ
jgi:hypothetical protein